MKLKYEKPLSNVAFKCNLRHYTMAPVLLVTKEVVRCRLTLGFCS